MKFGQSSKVFFNYSLIDAIKIMGEAGYDCIEVWGGRPHYYRDDLAHQLPEILSLLDQYKMTVPNFIPAQFMYPSILCSLNEKVRKESVTYIKTSIDTALKLQANSVSLCPGMSLKGEKPEDAMKAFKKSVAELLEYVANKPIKLIIEPAHQWETSFIFTMDEVIAFINTFQSSQLGINLDTGHVFLNKESLEDAVRKASRYPLHIHIDDNNGKMDNHMIPGEGIINFNGFVKAIKEIDYQGCISAELGFQYSLNPEETVINTLKVLKKMFK